MVCFQPGDLLLGVLVAGFLFLCLCGTLSLEILHGGLEFLTAHAQLLEVALQNCGFPLLGAFVDHVLDLAVVDSRRLCTALRRVLAACFVCHLNQSFRDLGIKIAPDRSDADFTNKNAVPAGFSCSCFPPSASLCPWSGHEKSTSYEMLYFI